MARFWQLPLVALALAPCFAVAIKAGFPVEMRPLTGGGDVGSPGTFDRSNNGGSMGSIAGGMRPMMPRGMRSEDRAQREEGRVADHDTAPAPPPSAKPLLVVLNGNPTRLPHLKERVQSLMSQSSIADFLLTSHAGEDLGDGLSTEMIKPHHFCSAPEVGVHKHSCNRPEFDNKFLGSVLLANATRHGFRWLVLVDSENDLSLIEVERLLEKHDYRKPHYFGMYLGKRGTSTMRPFGYAEALRRCPPLGPAGEARFWSLNVNEDITDLRNDCNPTPFRDDSWFGWGKGSQGFVISAGLLDKIPMETWQRCVDRIHTFGGDVRVGMCLALAGYRVQPLRDMTTSSAMSLHKVSVRRPHTEGNIATNMAVRQGLDITLRPRQKKGEAQVLSEAALELQRDPLFNPNWTDYPGQVGTVSAGGDSWSGGSGMHCETEYPEHVLVRDWVPSDATVIEFGGRFGTTSCELAHQLHNSGRLVVVEPDHSVWSDLETNLASHNCRAHVIRGVVSSAPVHLTGKGYPSRTQVGSGPVEGATIPKYLFDDVEKALGMKVDTLLIDCEGCAQDMMDQIGPKIRKQINLVIIEADMPTGAKDCKGHCMNYTQFFEFMEDCGFEKVDAFNDCNKARTGAPEDKWCGSWIDHYAFRRKMLI